MSLKSAPLAEGAVFNTPSTDRPKSSRLKRVVRVGLVSGLVLGLLLISCVVVLPYALPWLIQQQGIGFYLEKPQWHLNGLSVSQLRVTLPGDDASPKQVQLENLRINWAWHRFPIDAVEIEHLQILWPTTAHQPQKDQTTLALPAVFSRWLPQKIKIQKIDARLAGVGHLQGALILQASETGQLWQPAMIQSQLVLKNMQDTFLDSIPSQFRPKQLKVKISTHPDYQAGTSGQQLMVIEVLSEEPQRIQLTGILDLQQLPDWQASLNEGELLVQLKTLEHPFLQAAQLQAHAYFTAHANSNQFTVNLNKHSNLSANQLHFPDIGQAKKATLELAGLSVQGRSHTPYAIEILGPISAHLENLNIKQLHQQNWDFTGALSGELPRLELTGNLTGQHGLGFDSQIHLLKDSVQGNATVKEIFFKAGNPLQKTFTDWPELLSFTAGKLQTKVSFNLPNNNPFQLRLDGSASGLNGIINRSELSNINTQFNAQVSGQSIKLSIPTLTIDQLNPGIALSSFKLINGHYNTNLKSLLKGTVSWQKIQANLLNGKAWLDAQQLNLKQPQKLSAHVEGLELQELFKVYPAEGLAGTGIMDGELPIHIEGNTVYITDGYLQARQPGVLQFHSDKIKTLAEKNPTMQLLAKALEDFHFNLLHSALSYDQSGKLLLKIRLEGQNPDIEKGRPIHLSINLEENIPALLASIQLSGKVSEIIQKRIRERLKKR